MFFKYITKTENFNIFIISSINMVILFFHFTFYQNYDSILDMINLFKRHKKNLNPFAKKKDEAKEEVSFTRIIPLEWNHDKLVSIEDLEKGYFWENLNNIDKYTREYVVKMENFVEEIKKIDPTKYTSINEARKAYNEIENKVYALNDEVEGFRNKLLNFYDNEIAKNIEITFNQRFGKM